MVEKYFPCCSGWATLRALVAVLLLGIGLPAAVAADNIAQPVGDPIVEARITKLGQELRCLTCLGQSVSDSHSGFSDDMRREMRTMIAAGKSDSEIMDFMVQRYGDFVLYRPPVKSSTWLLWGGPFVLVVLSVFFLLRKLRQRTRAHGPVVLSKEDQQAAAALLGTKKDSE